jgi:uncharacterized protein (TIGR04255 family)
MPPEKRALPFLPALPPARYARNFLRQVVCELRFPTLFELNSSTPNAQFATAIRKSYPHHSHQIADMAVNGDSIERIHTHIFKSKNLDWSVTLRSTALTLEASNYTSFSDFTDRINSLLDIASGVIDSDFFTRIGLRYINIIPMSLVDGNTESFRGWVRESLVAALIDDDLGMLNEYSGRLAGKAEFGGFLFMHGVGYHPTKRTPEYFLDFDFWRDNVEIKDTIDTITTLHSNQFSMFRWALGPRAQEYLGESILKEN